jgi:hypothetical protein
MDWAPMEVEQWPGRSSKSASNALTEPLLLPFTRYYSPLFSTLKGQVREAVNHFSFLCCLLNSLHSFRGAAFASPYTS